MLPLLLLAGFDVRVHNAENEEELGLLSKAADVRNCGGILLVGSGKYAAPAVLDGLFVGNGWEARTSLAVFDPGKLRLFLGKEQRLTTTLITANFSRPRQC